MHGVGDELPKPIMSKLGFKNVMFVPGEEDADGKFRLSDPRNAAALSEGVRYLHGSRAGIMLAIAPAAE